MLRYKRQGHMGQMCILSELNETVRNGFPFSVLTLLVGQQVLFTD